MSSGGEDVPRAVRLLDQYTLQRKAALQRVYVVVSKYILLSDNIWAHAQTLLSGVLVMVSVLSQARGLKLFAFHPIFMNFMVMLMTEGVIVYRNEFLFNMLQSIMAFDAKTKFRNLHTGLQVCSAGAAVLGVIFIMANKLEFGKSLWPLSIHSFLGSCALLLVCVQVFVGFRKRRMMALNEQMQSDIGPVYRWHGKLGLVAYDFAVLAMVTGLLSYVNWSFANLLVVLSCVLTWFIAMTHAVLKTRPSEENQGLLNGGDV